MGSSKKVTVSYWYKLILHLGWCKGPIDALLEMRGGDRTAWKGRMTSSGLFSVNRPDLYGGESAEGGIQGTFEVMMGEPDQMPNSYMASEFGEAQPGYRGRATILLRGPKIGAGNPYPKPLFFKLERLFKGWDNNVVWYPETLRVGMKPIKNLAVYFAIDLSGSMGTITSNGQTRLANMKTALNGALDSISDAIISAGGAVDVMVVGFGTSPNSNTSILRRGATVSDITAVKAWINALTTMFGTYFPAGVSPLPGFVSGSSPAATMMGFFITDGEPADAGSGMTPTEMAQAAGAIVNSQPGFTMYGINIDLEDTTYTAMVDNTPNDAVPVVEGGDPTALTSVLMSAMGGLFGMNPAHILYDSITSRRENGGLEEPIARVNDASFRAAANKLYAEGFGLCCTWYGGESAEQFQQRICNVIGGSLTQSRRDGQYYLDLLRDVANPSALPTITDDDITSWEAEPATPSESINQIQVKWFDPDTREERITTPIQALGAIEDAGGVLADIREYYEIPVENLALRVAQRDLQSLSTALWKFTISCTRRPYDLRPGMQVRLLCPKRGFADLIVVIGDIDYGDFGNDEINIVAIQDVFSLPENAFVDPQEGLGPPSNAEPSAIVLQRAIEAPYVELVASLSTSQIEALDPSASFMLAGAARPTSGLNYTLATRAAGEEYELYGTGDWTPTAVIVEEADQLQETFTFSNGRMLGQVVIGTWALWGDEIVRVDAIDDATNEVTFGRGCADTVPQHHAAGSMVYFIGDWNATDSREYAEGESMFVKLLNRTSQAQIQLDQATEMQVDMVARQFRPYPPGDLRVNDDPAPEDVQYEFDLSWAHRDRKLQADQLVDAKDEDIGPEPGTLYNVRFYMDGVFDSETLAVADNFLNDCSVNGNGLLRVEVESERAGATSYQAAYLEFDYTGAITLSGVLPKGYVGINYNGQLTVAGGVLPYTWSLGPGAPAEWSIDPSTGVISGVATVDDTYAFDVIVEDAEANVATSPQSVDVALGDPNWANVRSLLHFDGADASTVMTDEKGKVWTARGDAQLDTAQTKWGSASLLLDGSGDYIDTPYVAGHFSPVNDFTIEAWVRLNAVKRHSLCYFHPSAAGGSNGMYTAVMPSGQLRQVFGSSAGYQTFDSPASGQPLVPTGAWTHVAVTKQGSTVRLFIGGTLVSTHTLAGTAAEANSPPNIGKDLTDAARDFNGWIDDFRYTDGVCRYTATFTPPDGPFLNG